MKNILGSFLLVMFGSAALLVCGGNIDTTTRLVKFEKTKYTAPNSDLKIEFFPDSGEVRIKRSMLSEYHSNSKCWVFAKVSSNKAIPDNKSWIVVEDNPYGADTVASEMINGEHFYAFYRLATIKN
jgi:hypothetical protein